MKKLLLLLLAGLLLAGCGLRKTTAVPTGAELPLLTNTLLVTN